MNDLHEFKPWPKIPRLAKFGCVITEKIDGTNAQLVRGEDGTLRAGSRTRWVTPEDDNFGFAAWVRDNEAELSTLPVGRYYGEWYGRGIQRGYGLDERRLALFWKPAVLPACVSVVPFLYAGEYTAEAVAGVHAALMTNGSAAVPGFMNPEGLVVRIGRETYKITDLVPGRKS